MRRKGKARLAAGALVAAGFLVVALLGLPRWNSERPAQGKAGVEFFALYRQCGHRVSAPELGNGLQGLPFEELAETLPAAEGWSVRRTAGRVEVVREMAGFCPEDAAKRYLASQGDYLAVFRGPAGAGGEMLRLLNLRLADLPEDWQKRLERGGLEFPGEQELLAVLDSLDEFQR